MSHPEPRHLLGLLRRRSGGGGGGGEVVGGSHAELDRDIVPHAVRTDERKPEVRELGLENLGAGPRRHQVDEPSALAEKEGGKRGRGEMT